MFERARISYSFTYKRIWKISSTTNRKQYRCITCKKFYDALLKQRFGSAKSKDKYVCAQFPTQGQLEAWELNWVRRGSYEAFWGRGAGAVSCFWEWIVSQLSYFYMVFNLFINMLFFPRVASKLWRFTRSLVGWMIPAMNTEVNPTKFWLLTVLQLKTEDFQGQPLSQSRQVRFFSPIWERYQDTTHFSTSAYNIWIRNCSIKF